MDGWIHQRRDQGGAVDIEVVREHTRLCADDQLLVQDGPVGVIHSHGRIVYARNSEVHRHGTGSAHPVHHSVSEGIYSLEIRFRGIRERSVLAQDK